MTSTKSKPGPKLRNELQREEIFETVAVLNRRGMSQRAIATEVFKRFSVAVSQQTISDYFKRIRVEYRQARETTLDEAIGEKLAQYAELRAEAWQAWERSKKNSKRLVQEFSPALAEKIDEADDGKDKRKGRRKEKAVKELEAELRKIKQTITTEGRLAHERYLHLVILCLNAERALLGLDEAKKIDLTTHQINWDSLLVGVDSRAKHQEIEEEIAGVGQTIIVQPEPLADQRDPACQ